MTNIFSLVHNIPLYKLLFSYQISIFPLIPKFQFQAHPARLLQEITRWWQVRRQNPPVGVAVAGPHVEYYDGNVGANRLMFIRPEAQTAELLRMGLQVVGRYAADGRELLTDEDGRNPGMSWAYYFCRKPGA